MSFQIISCAKPKPDWWMPSECSQREIVPMFFDKILTPVMFKGPAKVRRSQPIFSIKILYDEYMVQMGFTPEICLSYARFGSHAQRV